MREVVRKLLGQVQDLERTATRLAAKKSGPRDLKAMEHTLSVIPELETAMVEHEAVHSWLKARRGLVEEIAGKIRAAIKDDAPTKADKGNFIQNGFDAELDGLRKLGDEAQAWFTALEAAERKKTGISTLRVGSNAALGIYFETPKQPGSKVPGDWEQVHELKDKRRYTRADLRKRYAEQQDAGEQARTRELEAARGAGRKLTTARGELETAEQDDCAHRRLRFVCRSCRRLQVHSASGRHRYLKHRRGTASGGRAAGNIHAQRPGAFTRPELDRADGTEHVG